MTYTNKLVHSQSVTVLFSFLFLVINRSIKLGSKFHIYISLIYLMALSVAHATYNRI